MSRRHEGSKSERRRKSTQQRQLRLMDLRRHFFKRFRTTFETRRASHFSKTLRARQKIAIDSPHINGFELNRDRLAGKSHTWFAIIVC